MGNANCRVNNYSGNEALILTFNHADLLYAVYDGMYTFP